MQLFKVVNAERGDPTEVGDRLFKFSEGKQAKLGDGMYFAASRKDALEFFRSNHGRVYTHLLTCELPATEEADFISKEDPELVRFGHLGEGQRDRNVRFCEMYRKKGISAQEIKWKEFCLLKKYIGAGIPIIESEQLPTSQITKTVGSENLTT
jgi:hypothetical protein